MGLKNFAIAIAGKMLAKKLKLQEGNVDDKKQWYKSKGVWTGVVTVILGTYELVRANLAPQLPIVPAWALTLLGAVGVYSRAVAEKKIG